VRRRSLRWVAVIAPIVLVTAVACFVVATSAFHMAYDGAARARAENQAAHMNEWIASGTTTLMIGFGVVISGGLLLAGVTVRAVRASRGA
jgi:hypothetical protein